MSEPIVIVAARRTPIGAFQGALSGATAPELGAAAARAAIADSGVSPERIDEVLFGCVLQAGVGQAPARQAALRAGIPDHVPVTTINKVCGSGLKSVMLAVDTIRAGGARVMLAGGMESMTNAPYLLPKARGGYRMGHGEILDHMFFDGLQSPYDGQLMGTFAEQTAGKYGFIRASQDAFACESVRRALDACTRGAFTAEITPLTVKGRKSEQRIERDEIPFTCDIEKIPKLKPAFAQDGTVTAATSSSIADGAAALVIMTERTAREVGAPVLAKIVSTASFAHAPEWFTTAPACAIRRALDQAHWSASDVDLYEINEAFAVVTLAAIHDLNLDPLRVNVNGGACALGHPIGATGTRILVTLVHALRARNLRRGVAALCIGGGEAVAVAVEAAA
jgi:acetyl-CoA C-acetyltransferase